MKKKNILVINGHPDKESYCSALAKSYYDGAISSGADCKLIHLSDLKFDPILHNGYRVVMELERDLVQMQLNILEADHLVFVYPTWWGTFPALLKGFIDRVFLPKFAFQFRNGSIQWDKLLKGKSARLIVTMDTPIWYYRLVYKSPGHNAMKKGVLKFCGISPVKVSSIGIVKKFNENKRSIWLNRAKKLGFQNR